MNNGHVYKVNIGCGSTPTKGWLNFDNSISLKFSKIPLLPNLLHRFNIINNQQKAFMDFAKNSQILFANAIKRIPLPKESCEIVYSSHMLEHLSRTDATKFLLEVKRVLIPGGILRLAVPDLEKHVNAYLQHKDADVFLDATHLSPGTPQSLKARFRFLILGFRHHQWMYDGASLMRLLKKNGFSNPTILSPGKTMIKTDLNNLNLFERKEESLYVEAEKKA